MLDTERKGEEGEYTKIRIEMKSRWQNLARLYHKNWVSRNFGPFSSTRFLLEALDIRSNDKVLDLACGTGAVALELSDRLVSRGLFMGIDISRTSLLIAKKSVSSNGNHFIEMDAENIGLKGIFNKVTCQYALPLFLNPRRVMRNVRRILVTDGKLGVVVHGSFSNVPFFGCIITPIGMYTQQTHSVDDLSPTRFGGKGILEEILTEAGFTIISIRRHSFKYEAKSFDHYWSDFFTSGYANEVQPLVWSNDTKTILKIKLEAKKLASKYSVNNKIIFPWEVIIAIASV